MRAYAQIFEDSEAYASLLVAHNINVAPTLAPAQLPGSSTEVPRDVLIRHMADCGVSVELIRNRYARRFAEDETAAMAMR